MIRVLAILLIASCSYAICPNFTGEAYFTRANERDALYDYFIENTTDSYRGVGFNYTVSKTAYIVPFSSYTALYYLRVDVSYTKAKEKKLDSIVSMAISNLDTWFAQKRLEYAILRRHECSHDMPAGTCTPCNAIVIYKR